MAESSSTRSAGKGKGKVGPSGKEAPGDKKKRMKKRNYDNLYPYIFKTLRKVQPDISISKKAMSIQNSFVYDCFMRIHSQALLLAKLNRKKTIGSREIQTAVRLVLPGELAKHAVVESIKNVEKYKASMS